VFVVLLLPARAREGDVLVQIDQALWSACLRGAALKTGPGEAERYAPLDAKLLAQAIRAARDDVPAVGPKRWARFEMARGNGGLEYPYSVLKDPRNQVALDAVLALLEEGRGLQVALRRAAR
jgi:hypothetical protein